MNRYNFVLYGDRPYHEPDGTLLTSDEAAVAHAARIARELKRAHRIRSKEWKLAVLQGGRQVEVIDFATVQ